ncbi:MAG: hypothetical protein ACFCGT_13645 [Sandaracinaceae bacterium]
MDWLAHDEVLFDADLPTWARSVRSWLDGRPYDVAVAREGVVLRQGRATSALRWEELLVVVRLEEPRRLLLAAAREPPRPPWFELSGVDVGQIEERVRGRLEAAVERSYRFPKRARRAVPPDEVLTAILAHQPLPGAVEIPVASPLLSTQALQGGGTGAVVLALGGLALAGPWGSLIGAGVGAAGGAALLTGVRAAVRRGRGRVLVLTPDAFVGGLDGRNVSAVAWERVGRFLEGVDDHGQSALEVWGHRRELLARVAAKWFGAPLDVIVAVAEAYRERAVAGE